MGNIESPIRPRERMLPKDSITWNQKKKISDKTFDIPHAYGNHEPLMNLKSEIRIPHSKRLPMSSLLETGLMVLKIEGVYFNVTI